MPSSETTEAPLSVSAVSREVCLDILARIATTRPRVQCLTNTVAQAITANCLLAIGARVSMAVHPAEIVEMSAGASAVLINLGTIDPLREEAIARLIGSSAMASKPVVLDPVFAEVSPLRLGIAHRVMRDRSIIVRANTEEAYALRSSLTDENSERSTWVITGPTDQIRSGSRVAECRRGHPLMAKVTGLGCVLGAIIAAFHAIEPDPLVAATAALEVFGAAGEQAARNSRGPGSFAVALVDSLAAIDAEMLKPERHT